MDSTLGKRVKDLRYTRTLTQEQLGKYLNVSGTMIRLIEKNQRNPSIDLLNKMADFFNISTDYILKGTLDITQNIDNAILTAVIEKKSNTDISITFSLLKSFIENNTITSSNEISPLIKDMLLRAMQIDIDVLLNKKNNP